MHRNYAPLALAAAIRMLVSGSLTAQEEEWSPHGQFRTITEETQASSLQTAYRLFAEGEILDDFAQHLKQYVSVPDHITFVARQCGVKNAFYKPQSEYGTAAIIFCYEMADDILEEFQYEGHSESQLRRKVAGTIAFILYHEVGHAVIDLLQLPITGREEDAADQFAVLMLVGAPSYTVGAAEYFKGAGDFGDSGLFKWTQRAGSFGDEHSFDKQRFYNILCWTYGYAPEERVEVIEHTFLPSSRRRRCASEYEQMRNSWKRLSGSLINFSKLEQRLADARSTAQKAWAASAKSDLRNAMSAVDRYRQRHGTYPESLNNIFRSSSSVRVFYYTSGIGYSLGASHEKQSDVYCVTTNGSVAEASGHDVKEIFRSEGAKSPSDCF